MTNYIGSVYTKNDTKLSWSIGLGVDCDENQIGQLHSIVIPIGCFMLKPKLNYQDLSNQV